MTSTSSGLYCWFIYPYVYVVLFIYLNLNVNVLQLQSCCVRCAVIGVWCSSYGGKCSVGVVVLQSRAVQYAVR